MLTAACDLKKKKKTKKGKTGYIKNVLCCAGTKCLINPKPAGKNMVWLKKIYKHKNGYRA